MIDTPIDRNLDEQLGFLDKPSREREITASELRRAVRDFSQRVIRPLDDTALRDDAFPHTLWRQLGDEGLKGMVIPKQYGGMGEGFLGLCVTTQEIARASGAIAVSFVCDQALCSRQIAVFGNDAQKVRYLPKLASGESVGALAMSEPGAGSDVMGMRTRATKVDGGYVIDGSKTWITNGGRIDPATGNKVTADVLVLYAKTSEDPARLTTFIVEGGTKGFYAANVIRKATTRGSDTAELVFDQCFVPDSHVLGEVNKGAHVLMAGLNPERLMFAANALGVAQAALEETTEYLTTRQQFGLPVAFNQEPAHDLGKMYAMLYQSQDHMLSVAARADANPKALTNAAAASVFFNAVQAASYITEQARYYHGGNGQTVDYRADRQAGVVSLLRVGAGSEAMRKMRLAQDLIPGYEEHVKAERTIRKAFADALGIKPDGLQAQDIPAMIKFGQLRIVNGPSSAPTG